MLKLDIGVIVFFTLPGVEGTGILLSRVEGSSIKEPAWKVKNTAKDGSLTNTYEVPEACMYSPDKDIVSMIRTCNTAFISGLRQAEYAKPQTKVKQISTGSKKKSKSQSDKWAQKEKNKANGTFVPQKSSKHKKPDQKGKSQKKGKK